MDGKIVGTWARTFTRRLTLTDCPGPLWCSPTHIVVVPIVDDQRMRYDCPANWYKLCYCGSFRHQMVDLLHATLAFGLDMPYPVRVGLRRRVRARALRVAPPLAPPGLTLAHREVGEEKGNPCI